MFSSCVLPTLDQARLASILDQMKHDCLTLEDGTDTLWRNVCSYLSQPRKNQEERGSHIRTFHQIITFQIFLVKLCSRTLLIYLFLRFAGVSYGRFIAVRFGFNLSTFIQKRW